MAPAKRTRTVAVIAAALAVASAAGIAGFLVWAGAREDGPEAVADRWLSALVENDEGAARALMTPEADSLGVDGTAEPPSEASVSEVRVDADLAEVDVVLTLAGAVHEATVTLDRTPDGWRVGPDGLGAAEITSSLGDSVAIGGAVVPTGEVALLPGVYPVAAAPAEYLDGTASVSIVPGGTQNVAIDADLNDAGVQAVRDAVVAHLTACTRPADTVPDSCGLRVPWPADLAVLDTVAYRVERLPAVALTGEGAFVATDGVVIATANGTGREGAPASVTYRDDAWGVRGTLTVTGEEIRLGVL